MKFKVLLKLNYKGYFFLLMFGLVFVGAFDVNFYYFHAYNKEYDIERLGFLKISQTPILDSCKSLQNNKYSTSLNIQILYYIHPFRSTTQILNIIHYE